MIEIIDRESVKKVNLVVSMFTILMALFILVHQFSLFLKGQVTQNYIISLSVAFAFILISAITIYKRNPYSGILKRVTAYLYFIYYLILLFGSNNQLMFTIVSPILTIYVLYFELRIIRRSSILIILSNIILVLYNIFYFI